MGSSGAGGGESVRAQAATTGEATSAPSTVRRFMCPRVMPSGTGRTTPPRNGALRRRQRAPPEPLGVGLDMRLRNDHDSRAMFMFAFTSASDDAAGPVPEV